MQVKLVQADPDGESRVVEIARVSSGRKDKSEDIEGLLKYLTKNSHWSPFEHTYATVEIKTSKAIAIQMLRHRSFTFQEFSQRYQDVTMLGEMFEPIDLRRQAETNRQSSTESIEDADLYVLLDRFLSDAENMYKYLLDAGVAKECARMVLPMSTKTVLYMTGSLRSWVHFLAIRDDEHAQLEAQQIAQAIRAQLTEVYPITMGLVSQ